MAQVLRKEQVGKGLEVADTKLQVKAGAGIVVDNAGVSLDTSVLPEVPKAIANIVIDGTVVTKTFTDGTTATESLPEPTVDVKLAGLAFEGTKLKATLSDNTTTETDFTAEVVITAIEAMDKAQKDKVVAALLPNILEAIKGEELKDFADQPLGFLIKTDA